MAGLPLTKTDIEAARGEIFHMILFAMAWVMIGEYAIDFGDYVVAAVVVLIAVVILAFFSISLYNLEYHVEDRAAPVNTPGKRQNRRHNPRS